MARLWNEKGETNRFAFGVDFRNPIIPNASNYFAELIHSTTIV